MIALARSEPDVPLEPHQLDANPMVLNVLNGTLDLQTGKLEPHRRENLITKIAPVEYKPEASCPAWKAFLDQIMEGNHALIYFLQRAVGYALTGNISEQALFFLYGTGANGKTTFLIVVLALMGDYGCQAAPDVLLAKRGETHPTEVADLAGRRFVSTVEVAEGRKLAEVMVKQMTGGDRLKARRMRQDFFEFEPTFKIFLAANHKPTIRGTDWAIWRRIRLIPFTVTIPEDEQDKALAKKLKAELPGILNWALKGCLEWKRNGLKVPDEVRNATAEYRAEMDMLAAFIEARCVIGGDFSVTAKDLYAAYVEWCDENGEHSETRVRLGIRLRERGFEPCRNTRGNRTWRGIGLASDGSFDELDRFDTDSGISADKKYIREMPKVASNPSTCRKSVMFAGELTSGRRRTGI